MNPTLKRIETFTRLPVQVIEFPDRIARDLRVMTPHRGEVFITVKEESFGIFGGGFQYDKHAEDIVNELRKLEYEALAYLLDKWKATLKK